MKTPALPMLFVFSLLLAGCLQNPNTDERLACLELTSYSFTTIPKCSTQDGCFSQTQKSLGFDASPLNPVSRQELLGAQNHLARSWLFINNARQNLESIHSMCLESSYTAIPKEVNELNSNLKTAALEIDNFSQSAALAMNSELAALELDDINAVPQEYLFDDYVLLSQNALDFSQNNITGKTYAARFMREKEKFGKIAQALGITKAIQETTLFGIVSENKGTIEKEVLTNQAKKRDFPLWVVAPVFGGISDFLRDFFALGGSVKSLKSLPSFDVLLSLNNLTGFENSAASEFFSVFKSDAAHRTGLNEKNETNKQNAISSTEILLQRPDKMSPGLEATYSRGEAFLGEVQEGFSQLPFSAPGAGNFYSSYSARINSVKSSLRSLTQDEFLGTITLGAKTLRLHEINGQISGISDELDYFAGLSTQAPQNCSQELVQIQKRLDSNGFDSSDAFVISLRTRILSEIENFNDGKNPVGCFAATKNFSNLLLQITGQEPQQKTIELVDVCIAESEKIQGFAGSDGIGGRLYSLKQISRPYENPELVLNSCEGIRDSLIHSARLLPAISSAKKKFAEFSRFVFLLRSFEGNFSGLKAGDGSGKIYEKFRFISKNFEGGELNTDSFSGAAQIGSETDSAQSLLLEVLAAELSEAVEKYKKIDYPKSLGALFAGSLSGGPIANLLARISFENIAAEIPVEFTAMVELNSENAAAVFSPKNISFFQQGQKTMLRFSGLEPGTNSIMLDLNAFSSGTANPKSPDQNLQPSEASQKILSEKDSLVQKALSLGMDNNPEIEFTGEKIDFLAKESRLDEAGKELMKLRGQYSKAQEQSVKSLKQKAETNAAQFSKLQSLKDLLQKNSAEILGNFSELGQGEYGKISAFIPITIQRAKELSGFAAQKSAGAEEFSSLFAKGDYSGAIAAAERSNLEAQNARFESAGQEAQNVLTKMKENALSSYELAVQKIKSSEGSPQAQEALLKSKEALAEKSYLKSLVESTGAIGSAGPATGLVAAQKFEIPLPVYPLLFVVLIAIAYAWKKKQGGEKVPPQKVKKAGDENPEEDTMLF